ncbi:DUF2971 domain-containing protein [Aeromonas allosaccharophila]|uniref:DUF2971 domain-containing protein n=1 Tax=Aeromonas allosaccharophila TaxID=656 RepID=A0AAX3NRH7_9GAMM|nr:DUF2971 domain-containing protein [Aeromonas allosaccharophila]WED76239.1 DUF2971 domain-containing protein [Aeromonas allosaccharophila]
MYKYLSSFFDEILTEPSLRMAHVSLLNDTNEKKTHSDYSQLISELPAFKFIINEYKKRTPLKSEEELIKEAKEISLSIINNEIQNMGVISLCPNPTNDMMWGMYADGQAGVCVEYNISEFSKNYMLHKVQYCESKYNDDSFAPEGMSLPYLWDYVIKTALTRKKPSWSNEEESRFIIKLYEADEIRARVPSSELRNCLLKNNHSYVELSDGSLTIEPYGSLSLGEVAKHKEVLCLKKLKKNHLKSICFGENSPKEHIERAKTIIHSDSEVRHVSLYIFSDGQMHKID